MNPGVFFFQQSLGNVFLIFTISIHSVPDSSQVLERIKLISISILTSTHLEKKMSFPKILFKS